MAAAHPLPPPDDPILAAIARAPIGEPFTPEQRAELDQDLDDIRTGRARLIRHADRGRVLEELGRTQGE
jgi:hypothetical protein